MAIVNVEFAALRLSTANSIYRQWSSSSTFTFSSKATNIPQTRPERLTLQNIIELQNKGHHSIKFKLMLLNNC